MSPETKEELLHKIAQQIIEITYQSHKAERDIVGELYDNKLYVDKIIAQHLERIRMKEKGHRKLP